MIGAIHQLNIGPGGVPKLPIERARVTPLGIENDKHRIAQHGGPVRALCLYSLERIAALAALGHPIYPGSTGENITLAGIDWDAIAIGTRLALGDHVVVELTEHAVPCRVIQRSFADRRFGRVGATRYPGWARYYARVIATGDLARGDLAVVLPAIAPTVRDGGMIDLP